MFAKRKDSLFDEPASFEAVGGSLAVLECAAPLLLMPFWTGLPEARPVTGFTDDLDQAEGLTAQARTVSNTLHNWRLAVRKDKQWNDSTGFRDCVVRMAQSAG